MVVYTVYTVRNEDEELRILSGLDDGRGGERESRHVTRLGSRLSYTSIDIRTLSCLHDTEDLIHFERLHPPTRIRSYTVAVSKSDDSHNQMQTQPHQQWLMTMSHHRAPDWV